MSQRLEAAQYFIGFRSHGVLPFSQRFSGSQHAPATFSRLKSAQKSCVVLGSPCRYRNLEYLEGQLDRYNALQEAKAEEADK
jgi:hypothetical protein